MRPYFVLDPGKLSAILVRETLEVTLTFFLALAARDFANIAFIFAVLVSMLIIFHNGFQLQEKPTCLPANLRS